MSASGTVGQVPAGELSDIPGHDRYLPTWGVKELPAPPKFNLRNVMAVIGPGAIALSMAIGSGEWLVGPAMTVQFGLSLLWITTVAVVLQVIFNTEAIRYTLYTGEPVMTGFMRTWPGPRLWGPVYWLFSMLSNVWPGWASAAATALAALWLGRIPGAADQQLVVYFGWATFLFCVIVVFFGGKIERALELVSWFIVLYIFAFLLYTDIFMVSGTVWGDAVKGLVSFGQIPPNMTDLVLLGSFVAYSGAGGNGNALITNWMRDKGWGMAGHSGYIPSAIGGTTVHLSHSGNVFKPTSTNVARWKEWMKFIAIDQYVLWAGGCLLGMTMCTMLAVNFIKPGTVVGGWGVAAQVAEGVGAKGGQLLWILTLINGFMILWGTQLTAVDHVTRISTDLAWQGSKWLRTRGQADVRLIYYGVLILFVIWGMVALTMVQPLVLIMINANVAGLTFVFLSLHVLYINRKFLPKEVGTPLWKQIALVIFCIWSAVFVWLAYTKVIADNFFK